MNGNNMSSCVDTTRADDELDNWLLYLDNKEVSQSMSILQLRQDGSTYAKRERMRKWLVGEYTATDFIQADETDADTLRETRMQLRTAYINSKIAEHDSQDKSSTTNEELHPLSFVLDLPVIVEQPQSYTPVSNLTAIQTNKTANPLEQLRQRHATEMANLQRSLQMQQNLQRNLIDLQQDSEQNEPQHSDSLANQVDTRPNTQHTQPHTLPLHQAMGTLPSEGVSTITCTNGQTYEVPNEFLNLFANLRQGNQAMQREVNELKNSFNSLQKQFSDMRNPQAHTATTQSYQPTACSTRLHQLNTTHVSQSYVPTSTNLTFRDTYTYTHTSNPLQRNNTQAPMYTGQQQPRQPVSAANASRVQPVSSASSMQRAPHANGFATQFSTYNRSETASVRDVGKIVRGWNLHFPNADSQSIDSFLLKIKEKQASAGLTEDELLSALHELFTGVASVWFENNRDQWNTWLQFCENARLWFGKSRRFQQQLAVAVNKRTQHPDEPVSNYMTCLIAMLNQQLPIPPVEQQLDILHANMKPEMQRLVRRDQAYDITSLLELAMEAELTLQAEFSYQPPPPPENSLMPEVAYIPTQRQQTNEKRSSYVASTAYETAVLTNEDIEAMALRLIKEKLKLNSQRHNHRPRRKQDRDGNTTPFSSQENEGDTSESTSDTDKDELYCYKCGLPGYITPNCPNCSKNSDESA